MALKKPSDFFNHNVNVSLPQETVAETNQFELKKPSEIIEANENDFLEWEYLSEDFKAIKTNFEQLSNFETRFERITEIEEKIDKFLKNINKLEKVDSFLTKEELELVIFSYLKNIDHNFIILQENIKDRHKKDLKTLQSEITNLSDSVSHIVENLIPSYKIFVENEKNDIRKNFSNVEISVDILQKKLKKQNDVIEGFREEVKKIAIKESSNLIQESEDIVEVKINESLDKIVNLESNLKKYQVELEMSNSKIKDQTNKINLIKEDIQKLFLVSDNSVITENKLIKLVDLVEQFQEQIREFDNDVKNQKSLLTEFSSSSEEQRKLINEFGDKFKVQFDLFSNFDSRIKKIEQNKNKNYLKLQTNVDELNTLIHQTLPENQSDNFQANILENTLVGSPDANNTDPLTPLSQKFVTFDQLRAHYRTFINRVQQQLSSVGGGGETRLKYLDDIVGIATNPAAYDGKYLKYDHGVGKFSFSDVDVTADAWADGEDGPYTLNRVAIGTDVVQSGPYPGNNLLVFGNTRITGVVAIGEGTIVLDPSGSISSGDVELLNPDGGASYTGIVSALGFAAEQSVVSGFVTASQFSTGEIGSAINITGDTISGPSEIVIDPAGVGVNTGSVRIKGDLYVDGSTTTINSQTIDLADFRIGIGTTATSDLILDGAGIGIGSDGYQKTFTWDHQNSSLTSSENLNIPSGKTYKIDGVDVISSTTGLGTAVVNSSLTSVGTLNQLNVSGITTLTSLSLGGTVGNPGQYVKSTGSGTVWETFPTLRSTSNFIATPNQTTFSTSYNVGFIDVYVNGIRLTTSEFVATNGTSVVLNIPCFGGEEVDIISYNTVSTGSSVANAQYSGTVTATQGFTSGTGDAVQISVVGNSLTFTVPGVGSTTLTLYP